MEKISVIVPVYKVEKYLPKCIESIINQTYKNLEIILVDDGSPDNCGIICDEYAKKDERIKVIHKENGGLSDARNKGIDIATGEYITFLDSDDYIAPQMFEVLYKRLKEDDSDLSICNFLCVDEEYNLIDEKNQDMPIKDEVISGTDALKRLKGPKEWYYVIACSKLYKKEIFDELRYPFGKIHEDELLIHHVFSKCKRISCIKEAMYYYLQRATSIMGTKKKDAGLSLTEIFIDRASLCFSIGQNETGSFFAKKAVAELERYRNTNNFDKGGVKILKQKIKESYNVLWSDKLDEKEKIAFKIFNMGFLPYRVYRKCISFRRK